MNNSILKLIITPLVLTSAFPPAYSKERKKNVLFIAVDDMNNDLGCYGHPIVKSPGIDRLASNGIAFANAYCQFPLSSPSRSSLLTGMRPDKTRVFDLQYHFRQDQPEIVTLPQMFIRNGYFVARVGKMFHYGNPGDIGTNGLDDRVSWTERVNPAGRDKTSLELDVINYTPKRGLGSSMAYLSDKEGKDNEHTDGKVASEAIQLMEKHKDEPFFIAAGFYKPEALECKLAYYAAISFVDAQIGRLLDAVESLGLAENTIVVFWSDHGYHLGEHGLWFKQSCFEESARCPLIVSVPGMKKAGQTCRRPVEMVDIYPTLAELTGLTPPSGLEGYSLTPLLKNPSAKWKHPAYTQVQRGNNPGHSIRTETWRYTEWGFGEMGNELYNEIIDPHELNNLAGDPAHADIVKEMKALLKIVHPQPVQGGKAAADTRARFSN
jgi:iduronate 2-sulfatase